MNWSVFPKFHTDSDAQYAVIDILSSFQSETAATFQSAGVQNMFNSFQNDFDFGADRDSGYIYGFIAMSFVKKDTFSTFS